MKNPRKIVILTGAGISAESGLATFRGDGGLWEGHRVEDVATPEAFARQPDLVQRFYDARRAALAHVAPNAAHKALVRLEAAFGENFLLVTQNVDDLHERAGSKRLRHMHGALKKARCLACAISHDWAEDLRHGPACPSCDAQGTLRPDIVWFGEMPMHMPEIIEALQLCDLFISIGTSGHVYPAAGFVETARYCGAHSVEINLEPSQGSAYFQHCLHGPAGEMVPQFVETLLQNRAG